MKKVTLAILFFIASITTGFCPDRNHPTADNPLNYISHGLSPEAQMANERWAAQQQELANQHQYEIAAARQKKWDDAVAKIKEEAGKELAKLNEEYQPGINELKGQVAILEMKVKDLKAQVLLNEERNNHLREKQLFKPTDPWRMLDGKVCNAKDLDWYQFTGRVVEIRPDGILVDGDFGPPFEKGFGKRRYFVENFPNEKHSLADEEEIIPSMKFVAHLGGKTLYKYTNLTINLGAQTVRRLDYGKVVDVPPGDLPAKWQNKIQFNGGDDLILLGQINDNQNQLSTIRLKLSQLENEFAQKAESVNDESNSKITDLPNVFAKAFKEEQETAKKQREAKVLAFNQERADKGDPVALKRMGELYRDGIGVEKNSVKAAEYFKMAEAATETELNRINEENRLKEKAGQQQKFMRNLDLADRGGVENMVYVGKCYRDGIGVEKDLNKAREYLHKAADLGSEEAAKLLITFE